MKIIDKVEGIADAALRGMQPHEVDGAISELYRAHDRLATETDQLLVAIHQAAGDTYRRHTGWSYTRDSAIRGAQASGSKGVELVTAYETVGDMRGRVNDALSRLGNEYRRRGTWTRAFIVTDGHVHKSRECSTCNKGVDPTQFAWLPHLSGKTEAEIIEAASDRACTVCYPDAPVARGQKVPASKLSTPEERERQAARDERQRIKDEKATKAALNAITNVDGTPLRDEIDREGRQRGSIVKTIRTARSELKSECWYQYAWGDEDGRHERNIQHLARAIAWREAGLPPHHEPTREQIDAVIEPLRAKAAKEVDKARREQKN